MNNDTKKRVITSVILASIFIAVAIPEYIWHVHTICWAGLVIGIVMLYEFFSSVLLKNKVFLNKTAFWLFAGLLVLFTTSAFFVGQRPWIMLLLLLTIACADIGAWFFGGLFGGDKMWERLSPKKTWSGQIAGIICGTIGCVAYGLLGADTFMPQLLWIGISVSLLSQYGDITASWIKRQIGIKDFGYILPGHGGLLDRFDGWLYILPLIWLVLL